MMQLLLEMSICSAVFYGLFVLLYEGKNNHQFNRFYLLFSVLFSVGIPLLNLPVFPQYIVPHVTAESSVNTDFFVKEKSFVFDVEMGLIMLWSVGLFLNLFLFLKSIFSLFTIIKISDKKEEKNHIKVFTSNEMAVSSFLNYLFIPKEQRQTISDYEIEHELSHIRQKHSLDILFIEVLKAIFWFNPIIYLYKKRLIEIHEFLADQNTSNQLGKEAYKDFLIDQITTKRQTKLVHNFYSLFKKRLVMMQSNVRMKKWQYWAVLPLILVCFTLFSCGDYPVEKKAYPAIPADLAGEVIDTIITFDPKTKTETIEYVKSGEANKEKDFNSINRTTGIDTIIIFDPADYSETMIVVNHETGVTDTIR